MLDQENQQRWDQLREAQQQALALGAECRPLGVDTGLDRCEPRLSRPAGAGEPECLGPGAGKVAGREGGLSARAPERTAEIAGGVEGTGIPAGRAGKEPAGLSSLSVGQPSGGGISPSRLQSGRPYWLSEKNASVGSRWSAGGYVTNCRNSKATSVCSAGSAPTLPGESTPSPGSFQLPSGPPTRLSGMGP